MSQYHKTTTVEAVQWFKVGDHPKDRIGEVLSHPHMKGEVVRGPESAFIVPYKPPKHVKERNDTLCGETWSAHGILDSDGVKIIVCPGDWIVTEEDGWSYTERPTTFATKYKPV